MKKKLKLKGKLKLYMQWPAFMIILLLGMNIWIYTTDKQAGIIMSVGIGVYSLIVAGMYMYNKSLIWSDLVEFAAQYSIVQNKLLKELNVPYAILLSDGKIIWANNQFAEILAVESWKDTYMSKYIPDLNRGIFPKEEEESVSLDVRYQGRDYIAEVRCISAEGFTGSDQILQLPKEGEHFVAVHLQDVTELHDALLEIDRQKLVSGLIYIDNYDEVIESVEEVRQSLLVALIDRRINQYMANADGIVKKMEKDKYFVVMRKEKFHMMEKERFSLLEDVKKVSVGNKVMPTLSIGLGVGNDTYVAGYNYARVAIDLALARGGDQAVVKSATGINYYGGKREQMSKNTRVKARVKAEALREFMTTKERVIVMGHKLPDVDSFGAAIGIYRAAVTMGKKVNIVINDVSASLRPVYEAFKNSNSDAEEVFISSREAEDLAGDNTMIVVVDTNKPKMTDCERLLRTSKMVVVLDHHRQSEEVIENAILSYIEPYASSACEMVAEVLQYFSDDLKLESVEANCLYAGIMIDTNNFMTRTGVRTFEAAAYLRRNGADITNVRKLLRDDMESSRAKALIISNAEVYREQYAIASGEKLAVESPTIVGAQAANELLNVEGIKASFVLTEYNEKIYVSARAIDEVNVQIIMERLGGGGHINQAGAQFAHTDMYKAITTLKQTLDLMIEEGDI